MKYKKTILYVVEMIVVFAIISVINYWINNEILASVLLLIFLAVTFKQEYEKGEWKIFALGFILGLVLELGSEHILQLQYWAEGSILGTPIWLYLLWGIGFVYVRRIGNLLIAKK